MSYPYRVVVSKTVETVVDAKDRATARVLLTPLLPADAMKELLREALVRRGWAPRPGDATKLERARDGTTEVFDLTTLVVTTEVTIAETIRKEKTVEVVGDAFRKEDIETARDRLRAKASEELEKQLAVTDAEREAARKELERVIAAKLIASEDERRRDLNETLLDVYKEALRKKAASLGSVTSVKEERRDGGREYELTIKVAE